MKQGKEIPAHNATFNSVVEEQAAMHREAHRRLDAMAGAPVDTATGVPGRAFDTWSGSGSLPGSNSPDLQGPEPPLGFGVVPVPTLEPRDLPQNFEDIVRNPMGQKR